ncbi:MAG: hypothetical protein M3280_12965 [Actinomycetota bacterium]|nr:hypothetical protein [Actinomycetota bacterium]
MNDYEALYWSSHPATNELKLSNSSLVVGLAPLKQFRRLTRRAGEKPLRV